MISGATRVAGVIGKPVGHSLSPVLHNAAYQALQLDWVYVAFEVADGAVPDALAAVRALGLVGLSVTMPHKTAAAHACDDLTPDAAALESVNTVTLAHDGRLAGDSTDGEGFLRSLRDASVEVRQRAALVLGAGGAARAVALALARAGADVTIASRRTDSAVAAAKVAGAHVVEWDARAGAAKEAHLVVNATPVGMQRDESPMPANALHEGLVVADLVYHPAETALLRDARSCGAATVDGLGMLVHQAALQVERWTGLDAPVAAMRAAVQDALSTR